MRDADRHMRAHPRQSVVTLARNNAQIGSNLRACPFFTPEGVNSYPTEVQFLRANAR